MTLLRKLTDIIVSGGRLICAREHDGVRLHYDFEEFDDELVLIFAKNGQIRATKLETKEFNVTDVLLATLHPELLADRATDMEEETLAMIRTTYHLIGFEPGPNSAIQPVKLAALIHDVSGICDTGTISKLFFQGDVRKVQGIRMSGISRYHLVDDPTASPHSQRAANTDDMGWLYSQTPEESADVLFYFEDGTILSRSDLLRHPYSLILPSELLFPVSVTVDQHWQDYFDLHERLPLEHHTEIPLSAALASHLPRLAHRLNVPLYLGSPVKNEATKTQKKLPFVGSAGRHQTFNVSEVKGCRLVAEQDVIWDVPSLKTISGKVPGLQDHTKIVGGSWTYQAQTKELLFLPFKTWLMRTTWGSGLFDTMPVGGQDSRLTYFPQDDKSANLAMFLLQKTGATIAPNHTESVPAGAFRFALCAKSDREDQIAIALIPPPAAQGSRELAASIGSLATEALGATFEDVTGTTPRKGSADDADQHRRNLAMFRHQGFLHLAETFLSEYALRQDQAQDNREFNADELWSKFRERCLIIRKNGQAFDPERDLSPSLCDVVKKYLTSAVNNFRNRDGDLYFSVHGRTIALDCDQLARNVRSLVLHLLTQVLGSDLFTKKRIADLEFFLLPQGSTPDQIPVPVLKILHPRAREVLLAGLTVFGLDVYIDDEKVQDLPPDMLTASLHQVGENDGDWFDLHPKVFFGGEEITETDARRFAAGGLVPYKNTLYYVDRTRVPTARWLDYFWSKLKSNQPRKKRFSKDERDVVRQEPSWVLNMLALKVAGMPVIGGPSWKKIEASFERLVATKEGPDASGQAPDPETTKILDQTGIPLRPFQRIGSTWLLNLYDLGLGGLLADDMGLGKTVQAIAFLRVLHLRGELGRCLIVVPPSLLYGWQTEIRKFCPQLPHALFSSRSERSELEAAKSAREGVLITTYDLAARYLSDMEIIPWNVALFDEAQFLKNIRARRTGALRTLRARSKFCLSGTPLENHYGEFFSLLDLCVAGCLGSHEEFSRRYVPAKNSDQMPVEAADLQFLRMKSAPLVLRRSKASILTELPEKTESVITLDFEDRQKQIYRDTALTFNRNLELLIEEKGEAGTQLEMLTAILRMRQICSHPALSGIDYSLTPPKLSQLADTVCELAKKGESIIVFTNFRQTLIKVEEHLKRLGLNCLAISGTTPAKQRVKILQKFDQTQEPVILLMTQKVGGVGLNLTKSSYVFHLEPWWNPQVEHQATDRVHRIGQQRSVHVYRYIMADSIEEKIQALKSKKERLFHDLFESEADVNIQTSYSSGRISREEFNYLLS